MADGHCMQLAEQAMQGFTSNAMVVVVVVMVVAMRVVEQERTSGDLHQEPEVHTDGW